MPKTHPNDSAYIQKKQEEKLQRQNDIKSNVVKLNALIRKAIDPYSFKRIQK